MQQMRDGEFRMHLEARTLRAKKLQAFVQVSSDYRGDIFSAWGQ